METSFWYGKYLISLFKLFYNINKLCFQKILDVTEDLSKYFLKLFAVRKVLETMKFQALGSFEPKVSEKILCELITWAHSFT